MAKVDAWMPVYIGDYLADTAHLTTEQHGAYLLLIFAYWRIGPLADNDAILAQITRLPLGSWMDARSIIRAFFKHSNGMLVHTRIDNEKTEAQEKNKKNSEKAAAAANKRWGKYAPSIPQALLKECPSQSQSQKDLKYNISAEQGSPPEISLSLNDGREYPITTSQRAEWETLFPAVNVPQELRNMRAWLLANPRNRKTKSGVLRFATSWLTRQQNSAKPGGTHETHQPIDNSAVGQIRAANERARQREAAERRANAPTLGAPGDDVRPPLEVEFRTG